MNAIGEHPNLGSAFKSTLAKAFENGRENVGRNERNLEIPALMFSIDNPLSRIIDMPERRTNAPFLIAECVWQLACRTDVASLSHYAPQIGRFSADGINFTGSAYGPRLFLPPPLGLTSQWGGIIACLKEDHESRRAIMHLGDPSEERSLSNSDYTCTTSLHFLVRNGRLDLMSSMRSNDIMRGLQSDVFFFTVLQEIAAVELGLPIGIYTHVANLAQIYARDFEWAQQCASGNLNSEGTMEAICSTSSEIWSHVKTLCKWEESFRRGDDVVPDDVVFGSWQRSLQSRNADDGMKVLLADRQFPSFEPT